DADEIQPDHAGFVALAITSRGDYSGRLQLGAKRYSFSGRFDGEGQATNTVSRKNDRALTIELHAAPGDLADELFGRVTDGIWSAGLPAARAVFDARLNPAPFAGKYTMFIDAGAGDPAIPAGEGFGTLRVDASGKISLSGMLADGTKIAQTVPM